MRSRTFEVPVDLIFNISKIIEDEDLGNNIEGVTDDGDIQISIDYEHDQKKVINHIHDIIDEYKEEHEDDEDDEDEDED